MKKFLYFTVIVGIILVGYLLLTEKVGNQIKKVENTTVKIGYQQTSLYQHLFLAVDRGLFNEAALDVELVPFTSANQMMSALLAGKIDVTGLTNMEVALRIEARSPDEFEFANMLVWNQKAFPDYLLDCTDKFQISSVNDISGRILGRHPGSAVDAFAREVLSLHQVDLKKVQFVELKPPLMRESVVSGSIDALYAMDPVSTQLINLGVCKPLLENPLGTLIESPIPIAGTAISKKFMTDFPEAAKSVQRVLDKGIELTRNAQNSVEVLSSIERYTELDAETVSNLRKSIYWTSNEVDLLEVQRIADKFYELNISEKKLDVTELFSFDK